MKTHKVKKFGGSGHVILSKNLVGKYVRILTVEDDIINTGEIQRMKFKIETYESEIENIKRNNRIRNREEIIKSKSLVIEGLKRLLAASEKASSEAE